MLLLTPMIARISYEEFRWLAWSSLQNKIWILPDRSTILPKFIYDKEGKLAGTTQILLVRVPGPALILKTDGEYGDTVGLHYTQDYLTPGICSLIKPAAVEKLIPFLAKIHTVML